MKRSNKRFYTTFVIILLSFIVVQCSKKKSVEPINNPPSCDWVYPQPDQINDGWETSTLIEESVDPCPLYDMMQYIEDDIGLLFSILIIKNEKLVFEEYFNEQDISSANNIWSTSKWYLGTLVGIALREGYITSLDQKMMDFFPEYDMPDLDPRKYDITIRQLLQMRAGIPGEFDYVPELPGNIYARLIYSENWIKFTIEMPLVCDPGQEIHYSTPTTHLLSGIITKATGMSTLDFAEQYLFGPANIVIDSWDQDPQGYNTGGWGMFFTPRNMARFGNLYLNNGYANGNQIVPSEWIEDSQRLYSGGQWTYFEFVYNRGYGYQMDIGRMNGYKVYYRLGRGGQLIFNIPSLNVVVVTSTYAPLYLVSDEQLEYQQQEVFRLIHDYILQAIK